MQKLNKKLKIALYSFFRSNDWVKKGNCYNIVDDKPQQRTCSWKASYQFWSKSKFKKYTTRNVYKTCLTLFVSYNKYLL